MAGNDLKKFAPAATQLSLPTSATKSALFDYLVVRPCAFAVLTLRGAVKGIIIEQKQQVAANQCDWPSKAKSRLPQGENKLGSKSLFRARRIHTARKTEWSTPCRFTRTASSNESCHS
jgi:hypothetical protein